MTADDRPVFNSLPPPLANSYWVLPGRLLAGEYPGAVSRREARERLEKLVSAGVNSFVDLTEEDELPPYERLLADVSERPLRYRRFSITDHSIPESPARMAKILDYLDAELLAGRCVYVHCRAGIGRTGTTIACHLIRSGLANQAALDHLQTLWKFCGRARSWPKVPETDEQIAFVLEWRDRVDAGSSADVERLSRFEGALVGLALGEAFGLRAASHGLDVTSAISGSRTFGVLHTGAETAMTRAVGESLLAHGAHDPRDQMQRYLDWTRSTPSAVPAELKKALAVWQFSRKVNAGSHDPKNLDAHTLSRTVAAAMFASKEVPLGDAIELAVDVSRTTQQSPVVLDLCRLWAAMFLDAFSGLASQALIAMHGPAMQLVRARQLKPPVKQLIDRRSVPQQRVHDALSLSHTALHAFASGSGREALLRAASGSEHPSAGALCGALVGAHEGIDALPAEWRAQLAQEAELRILARRMAG